MTIDEIEIGMKLVHRSNALLSGWVRGVDAAGPPRQPGPCVWLDCPERRGRPWRRVVVSELAEYTKGAC
jgi:hypothetical protein